MNFLFIAGCPRSGTTALLELLHADPRMALGLERFKRVVPTPASFEPAHFLSPTADETNIGAKAHYRELARRLESDAVEIIGDKTPGYYKKLPALRRGFPDARFILLFRDIERVASSFEQRARRPSAGWPATKNYREGIEQWNDALRLWQRFEATGTSERVFPLCYEWFFCGDLGYLRALYGFLGLTLEPHVIDAYFETASQWNRLRKKPLVLDKAQRAEVASAADHGLETWAKRRAAGAIARTTHGGHSEEDAKRLARFAPFVLAARDEQIHLLNEASELPSADAERSRKLLLREAGALARRSASLREQIEAREASAWWRLGRMLHRMIGGRGGHGVSESARRVERSAARLAQRVDGGPGEHGRS